MTEASCFRGVVKVHCEGAAPCYTLPWQIEEQDAWTGSGFFVAVGLIGGEALVLTNAHVVENAFVVRVSGQRDASKRKAKVVCVAPDLDLALLRVLDLRGWPVYPLRLAGELPALFSSVHALGFPEGGNTICVTKGVVSRVDAQLYAHMQSKGFSSLTAGAPGKLLILQIDAAINAGNSGGPAMGPGGEVIGVASSGLDRAQNVGYIVPACLATLFITEFARTAAWGGTCELGFAFRTMESEALRDYVGVQGDVGVLLTSVAPFGPMRDHLARGDVLLAVDGAVVHSDGTVFMARSTSSQEDGAEVQLPLDHCFTEKPKGTPMELSILRDGRRRKVCAASGTVRPLLPRYGGVDAFPSFAIFGGLVFARLSMPLFNELTTSEDGLSLAKSSMILSEVQRWQQIEDQEVVILLRVLRHAVNEGIDASGDLRVVTQVNGESVLSLAALVQLTMKRVSDFHGGDKTSRFVRFGFRTDERNGISDVSSEEVLALSGLLEADSEILAQNGVPAPVSADLQEVYAAAAPRSVALVSAWLACLRSIGGRCTGGTATSDATSGIASGNASKKRSRESVLVFSQDS